MAGVVVKKDAGNEHARLGACAKVGGERHEHLRLALGDKELRPTTVVLSERCRVSYWGRGGWTDPCVTFAHLDHERDDAAHERDDEHAEGQGLRFFYDAPVAAPDHLFLCGALNLRHRRAEESGLVSRQCEPTILMPGHVCTLSLSWRRRVSNSVDHKLTVGRERVPAYAGGRSFTYSGRSLRGRSSHILRTTKPRLS